MNKETIINQLFASTRFSIIAGPCAVESEQQLDLLARKLSFLGVEIFRGGAFKSRTSPDSFQGLGVKGLQLLQKIASKYKMIAISEIMSENQLEAAAKYVDIMQVGARNMQNIPLLKAIGKQKKPVLLKRGFGSTINEVVEATKYISDQGNQKIILCERGIRTFEPATRFTLDLSSVPIFKEKTPYPVFVDPSHASGRAKLVPFLSRAALAIGADGLMIEVHETPQKARSDGLQSLTPIQFSKLLDFLKPMAGLLGKKI
ncbi:MAG: 3-deoxy-7-phosphoheptulonate synthase [Deltaproteobacteria bacterium]|jgi:3-deoxy-7-phosphoheptulonate synthase|nr:3-deoxy-7-phosphoheptulonate synthase [Deltaproteobacteria bacterium]